MSSRVDEDRQAARSTERLAETKRNEEAQKNKRVGQENTFKKLVGQQHGQQQALGKKAQDRTSDLGRSAIASLLEAAEGKSADEAKGQKEARNAFSSRVQTDASGQRRAEGGREEGRHSEGVSEGARQTAEQGVQSSGAELSKTVRGNEGRRVDSKQSREALEERHESSELSAGGAAPAGGARSDKGDLKADADKGGQGQGGSHKDGKDGAPAMQPGFRFNPALMAPVPVAQQKQATGSERLRKVANELAQKIVERVRVGTNAAGRVEFQIDLRSDVLKGLSVKVSSHNGKIKAVFQGSDRDVLKMIEEQREALTQALKARGLSLEDFRVEGR